MDAILLKIKRQFTHDEAVACLQSELKKVNFKNGELLSEIAELKDTLKRLDKKAPQQPRYKLTKEDLKEERFIQLNKKLDTQGKTIKRLKGDVDLWRSKWLNLSCKTNV